MTTRTTTIEANTKGTRALIGATAATLALLGGALLWQARPSGEAATPRATASSSTSTVNEGGAPAVTDAEMYQRGQQAEAAPERTVNRVLVGSEAVAAAAPAGPVTDQEMYRAWQAAARTGAVQPEPMGGLAELYRDQAQRASGAP